MSTTKNVIKLFLKPDEKDSLILRFQELMTSSPSFCFNMAKVKEDTSILVTNPKDPAFFPITLYTNSSIVVKVAGVHCGQKYAQGQTIVDLLRFCGFRITEDLANLIMNSEKVDLTLRNENMIP